MRHPKVQKRQGDGRARQLSVVDCETLSMGVVSGQSQPPDSHSRGDVLCARHVQTPAPSASSLTSTTNVPVVCAAQIAIDLACGHIGLAQHATDLHKVRKLVACWGV
jgi:hypothetical protein